MTIYLETERLILRELTLEDEENLLSLDSDPKVMRFLTNGVPSTREQVRAALAATQALYRKHNGIFGFWAALHRNSKEFMGWFHFRPSKADPDNVKRIELGYRLKQQYWGSGYATEGSRALMKKGFEELGVEEVFAITMEKNLASRKVMERIGLEYLREFYDPAFPGTKEKDVEYSLSLEKFKRTAR